MNSPDRTWSARHRVVLPAAVAVGALMIVLGWYGAARTTSVETQAGWAVVATAGVAVGGAGQVSWLRGGLSRTRDLRRRVLGDLDAMLALLERETVRRNQARRSITSPGEVEVLVAGGTFSHRVGCPVTTGKSTAPLDRSQRDDQGHRPCGICHGRVA